ncbi:ATP-binding cassette domain-containing protein [Streptomyces sp. NPDC008092]|uniref:ABC transporter ATP-binding protein n=1 Tax=Streptomyces sp. NPDC008092 TaxID=3364808 RepID=UPI0036EE621C
MLSLALRDLSVAFGGVHALDGVTLEVAQGSLTGLIGPNGAGKTTLLDACTGYVTAHGEVHLGDRRIDGLAPYRRARAGLVRTFQSLDLFDDLTVAENVATGMPGEARPRWWHQLRRMPAADTPVVHDLLASLGLDSVAGSLPGSVSQGQRALVALARALIARPDVLLLDEPAAGLDSHESEELGRRLRDVCDRGTTVLLVEHDMSLVLGNCDHVHVLDAGKLLASGTPAEVRKDPAVLAAYLGEGSPS